MLKHFEGTRSIKIVFFEISHEAVALAFFIYFPFGSYFLRETVLKVLRVLPSFCRFYSFAWNSFLRSIFSLIFFFSYSKTQRFFFNIKKVILEIYSCRRTLFKKSRSSPNHVKNRLLYFQSRHKREGSDGECSTNAVEQLLL